MKSASHHKRTRAQESSNAIERIYITMRHLFNRGFYKPMGISGTSLREALLILRPEIYGSIAEEKIELQGLLYVIDRLPYGIEECSYINLTSDEGYNETHFKPIIPLKRRRNCYRIDEEQMNIEVTRGRSEIYDILTHLTFLFIESHKIKEQILIDEEGAVIRDWQKLEAAVLHKKRLTQKDKEIALTHTANFLGRTYQEVKAVYSDFACKEDPDRFLKIIYFLGNGALKEHLTSQKRIITFSPVLRERLGHHIHGEQWANRIKKVLYDKDWIKRPLHIISANMHSVMNTLFAKEALSKKTSKGLNLKLFQSLSKQENISLREKVFQKALENGMVYLPDESGTNIDVQLFDSAMFKDVVKGGLNLEEKPILLVMDYAFGEQAYETMDELLKPFKQGDKSVFLNVISISIMGKAGILKGGKGDIMIPDSHIFEGTADNYPFKNELKKTDFNEQTNTCCGSMITVLGTSLQNKDILQFFKQSSWKAIGLEMEGAHYQKAIQAASKIRKSINPKVVVRYAYYASDNPLESGSTLASGGLGTTGVKPTYLITQKILEQIFQAK